MRVPNSQLENCELKELGAFIDLKFKEMIEIRNGGLQNLDSAGIKEFQIRNTELRDARDIFVKRTGLLKQQYTNEQASKYASPILPGHKPGCASLILNISGKKGICDCGYASAHQKAHALSCPAKYGDSEQCNCGFLKNQILANVSSQVTKDLTKESLAASLTKVKKMLSEAQLNKDFLDPKFVIGVDLANGLSDPSINLYPNIGSPKESTLFGIPVIVDPNMPPGQIGMITSQPQVEEFYSDELTEPILTKQTKTQSHTLECSMWKCLTEGGTTYCDCGASPSSSMTMHTKPEKPKSTTPPKGVPKIHQVKPAEKPTKPKPPVVYQKKKRKFGLEEG